MAPLKTWVAVALEEAGDGASQCGAQAAAVAFRVLANAARIVCVVDLRCGAVGPCYCAPSHGGGG